MDCKTEFYTILYMVIGHRTNRWSHFITSTQKLSTEEDLSHKVRKPVYSAVNGEIPMNCIPNCLGQIVEVIRNTLYNQALIYKHIC